MTDNIPYKKSTLEIFPNEIFLELFSYIKPIDLYHGFVNLNSRINTILHNVEIHIQIINNNQYEQYKNCIEYFTKQIIYLSIDCHWLCLSNNISLKSFINLRSLHIPMASDKQCEEILPEYLPLLINLTIHDNGFKKILFHLNKFSNLSNCYIPHVYSSIKYKIESIELCLTLKSLHLYNCSIKDLYDILQFLPNLKYLEIILLSIDETISYFNIKHKNISNLKVKVRKLEPDLDILLESMPNILYLEFLWNDSYGWDERYNFNFEKFSYIIEKNLKLLKHLDINLRLFKFDYDIETIHYLNPEWYSLLSIQNILHDGSIFITTKRLSSNTEDNLMKNLLQSTYIIQRNKRINQAYS